MNSILLSEIASFLEIGSSDPEERFITNGVS